jgi:hypothetical protein
MEASSLRLWKELTRFKAFVESRGQETGNWLSHLPYHVF